MFVHPRVNCSPEQLGKAEEQWTRLLETRLSNMPHSAAQNNCSTPEFISLDNNNSQANTEDYHHTTFKRRRENRASTYGLAFPCQRRYRQPPWKPKGHRYSKGINGLHEEILHFFEFISPRPEEHAMRRDVVRRIQNVIHETWPTAEVEIFGSFRTGLYLPTSDIDMVIFGKWEDPPLNTMERKLIESGICQPTDIKVLNNATVPIVKLVDSKTDVKVDISYNMDSGIKSARYISDVMKKYPYLKHLVLVLKQFLLERDLNEVFTGGVSSYSLILMVISFLQLHPRQDSIMASPNLGVLLIEFFELYGVQFNYMHIGLRIRDGGAYKKKEELMQDMDSAYKQSLLCIEDPLYPTNDVGRSSYNVMHVKHAFKNACSTLNNRVMRQYYYLYEEDESILSRIIHVTRDVEEYRDWIKENFPLTSPPSSSPSSSPTPTYSYACAVKTGTSSKDLSSNNSAAPGPNNGSGPVGVGKSDGEESDASCVSSTSSSASGASSMSRSSPSSLSAVSAPSSVSASACNTPPSSSSCGDSEDDEHDQQQQQQPTRSSSTSTGTQSQSPQQQPQQQQEAGVQAEAGPDAEEEEEAGVSSGAVSASCTAAPALAPRPSPHHYRDAVLTPQHPPQPQPRKSHSSNNRFRPHYQYHHNFNTHPSQQQQQQQQQQQPLPQQHHQRSGRRRASRRSNQVPHNAGYSNSVPGR